MPGFTEQAVVTWTPPSVHNVSCKIAPGRRRRGDASTARRQCAEKADAATQDPALSPSLGAPRRADRILLDQPLHQRGKCQLIRYSCEASLTLTSTLSLFSWSVTFRKSVVTCAKWAITQGCSYVPSLSPTPYQHQ